MVLKHFNLSLVSVLQAKNPFRLVWTKFGKSVHCAKRGRERVICQNVARLACHLFCSELTLTSTVLHRVIKRLTEPKESECLSISLSFNFNYFSSSNLPTHFMVKHFHQSNLPVFSTVKDFTRIFYGRINSEQ